MNNNQKELDSKFNKTIRIILMIGAPIILMASVANYTNGETIEGLLKLIISLQFLGFIKEFEVE